MAGEKDSPDPSPGSTADPSRTKTPSDDDPIKIWAAWFWKTRPGRWFALGYVALGLLGWLIGQYETVEKFRALFKTPTTFATLDEINCLNEWVLKLATVNNQGEADQMRSKFLDEYKKWINQFGLTTSTLSVIPKTLVNG